MRSSASIVENWLGMLHLELQHCC